MEFKLNEMSRLSVADETRTSIKSGDGGGITISLQVSDIEQTRAELMDAGIIPTHQPRKYGVPKQYTCVTLKEIGLSFGRDGQGLDYRRKEAKYGASQISCSS